ncbi:MAG: zf-HC2 domain-containing protein [Acidobacteriota bacterium]|nr:zf-HC2 domain-containing protein [Acidobacteriota bacterium]
MRDLDHLDSDLLIQFLDGELPDERFVEVREHLAFCAACRQRRDEFGILSFRVDALVSALPAGYSPTHRIDLTKALVSPGPAPIVPTKGQALPRFAWALAAAASLVIGIILASGLHRRTRSAQTNAAVSPASIEVNGESFLALPYSNPDLPVNAPRIVEMQVPVASLAEAGIYFSPAANGSVDRTVAANVLLGLDGQPLGVHVLSSN